MRTVNRKPAQTPKARPVRRAARPIKRADERTRRPIEPIDHRQPGGIGRSGIHRPINRINRQRRRDVERVVQRRARARRIQVIGKHASRAELLHRSKSGILVGRNISRTPTSRINRNTTHHVVLRPDRKPRPRHIHASTTEPLHPRSTCARLRVASRVEREDITGQRHHRNTHRTIVKPLAELPITNTQPTEPTRKIMPRRRQRRPTTNHQQQPHNHQTHHAKATQPNDQSSHAHSSSSTHDPNQNATLHRAPTHQGTRSTIPTRTRFPLSSQPIHATDHKPPSFPRCCP